MRYRILGPLEVLDDTAQAVQPGHTERQLLAMFLLHPGEVIATDRLADAMWGDALPANPANALQARVSRLRKLVGRDTIVTRPPGYAIELGDGEVDAARFEGLLARARATPDPAVRLELLDEALALWRGPALADVVYEDFARAEAERLESLRIDALEARIDALIGLGEDAAAASDLERLVIEHPFRESLYQRQMLALYRQGRQAEALRVFSDAKSRLGEELGIEPGPGLVATEEAILLQDPSLLAGTTVDDAFFPTPLTSFVGRSAELAAVAAGLQRSRLVTLLGPGGVGKTRLAVEAVAALDTDRVFIDLGGVTADDLVVAEMAAAFRLDRGQGGLTPARIDLEDALVAHLIGRNLVMVVDNCEHVVDEVARLVEGILLRVPDLRVMATSRERLGVPGEMVMTVPPMSVDGDGASEAARLFVDRATSLDPEFSPDGMTETIADICVRLDGIPLAIELAAARTRTLGVAAIASRLDDRFRLLSGGSRTAIARQRTLRAAIDWSHQLLDEPEKVVFRRIALLAGPFGIDSAVAVAGGGDADELEVIESLDRLVDQSMVVRVSGAEPRFRLLENLRAYGREQLAESDDGAITTRRMIDHYAAMAGKAYWELRTRRQEAWMDRLSVEYDNITAALDLAWSVTPDAALAITAGLGWFWYLRGMFEEADRRLSRAREVDEVGVEGPLADVYFATAMMTLLGPAAVPPLEEAIRLGRVSGNWFIEAAAMAVHGAFVVGAATEEGLGAVTEARRIFDEHEERWGGALCLFLIAAAGGRPPAEAAEYAATALEGFRTVGDGWGEGYAELVLGAYHQTLGDYPTAIANYTSAMARAHRIGVLHEVANIRTELAYATTLNGDFETAAIHAAEALDLSARYPWAAADAGAANSAGYLARRLGHHEEAVEHHRRARDIYRSRESPQGTAQSLGALAYAEEQAGRVDDAAVHHLEGLRLTDEFVEDLAVAFAFEGLAAVAAVRGDGTIAARLHGAADRLRADRGAPLPSGEDYDVARARAMAAAVIGEAAYGEAFAEGRRMGRDAARDLAESVGES